MSFLDSLLGNTAADAAKAAARDQYKKQKQATTAYNQVGDQYQSDMLGLSKAFQPYASAGSASLERLLGGLGLAGPEAGAAFTDAYRNLPGYQAGLNTGTNAVNTTANARGMLNSGANEKALYRFGSDYENARSSDYLARLLGLTQLGQGATGSEVATAAQGMSGRLGQRGTSYGGQMQSAGTIGQGMVAGANAQSEALTNLLKMGAYGVGAAFGSPWVGTALGFGASTPSKPG